MRFNYRLAVFALLSDLLSITIASPVAASNQVHPNQARGSTDNQRSLEQCEKLIRNNNDGEWCIAHIQETTTVTATETITSTIEEYTTEYATETTTVGEVIVTNTVTASETVPETVATYTVTETGPTSTATAYQTQTTTISTTIGAERAFKLKRSKSSTIPPYLKSFNPDIISAACLRVVTPTTVTVIEHALVTTSSTTTNTAHSTVVETVPATHTLTVTTTVYHTVPVTATTTETSTGTTTTTSIVTATATSCVVQGTLKFNGISSSASSIQRIDGLDTCACYKTCMQTPGCKAWLLSLGYYCFIHSNAVGMGTTGKSDFCPDGTADLVLYLSQVNIVGGPGPCAGTVTLR